MLKDELGFNYLSKLNRPKPITMKDNIILKKSFDYALKVIKLSRELNQKKEFILSKQLLRSGTSVGANAREANNAPTKKDFIYKLTISQKECDESLYWLELLHQSNYIEEDRFNELRNLAEEQLKILKSIIITSRNNLSHRS